MVKNPYIKSLLPNVPYMARLAKIFIIILEVITKKKKKIPMSVATMSR